MTWLAFFIGWFALNIAFVAGCAWASGRGKRSEDVVIYDRPKAAVLIDREWGQWTTLN